MKKIQYNSPVILTYFFISLSVLILNSITHGMTNNLFFSVYKSSIFDPLSFIRLFGHVLGHDGLNHFMGNMMLLLVVGPAMEKIYGSKNLLISIVIVALVSGIMQTIFFPGSALLGASGIVFLLIMMSSLSGMKSGYIPLTLILVAVLYLGKEVYSVIFIKDNVANFMHIVGGVCGAGLGYGMDKNK